MKISRRVKQLQEYAFSKLAKKSREVEKKTGRKILDLSIGSPDFPPSKKYIEKLKKFYDDPSSSIYPGYEPISEFKEAITGWYQKRFGVLLEKNEICALLGAKDGTTHLPFVFCDRGDVVLVPDPGYPGFISSPTLFDIQPVYYPLAEKDAFEINLKTIEKKITKKTKFIWINFPSNPTGQVIAVAKLHELVDFCRKNKLWIIYDNAYSEISFDGYVAPSILQIKSAKNIAVELGSFSKTFSFAGYRMGWAVGNAKIIEGLKKVKTQVDSGLSRPLQRLGAYALDNFDTAWYKKMLASYRSRRDAIIDKLKSVGIEAKSPKAGLYLWVKIPEKYRDSEEFCYDLLEKKQVLVAPGTAFGKNGKRYIRVSFCSDIEKINKYF